MRPQSLAMWWRVDLAGEDRGWFVHQTDTMAKHITKKEARFQIEFRPSEQASARGGQVAVNALLNQFGLWQRIKQAPALEVRPHKGKGDDPVVCAAQTLFCVTSGGVSLADAERLDEDASFKELLGLKKCPAQSALGQWLRQAGAAGGVEALRQINRDFAQWILQKAPPPRYLHSGRLECFFDDTQIEVSGPSYLDAIAQHFGAWSVSYNKWVEPLEKKAQEWPETEWSAVEKTRWRDGTEQQAQDAWFRYQPGGCASPKLFAVVRPKSLTGDLFWRYAFLTCQEQTGWPRLAFEHHRLKGDKERAFSDLLSDLDLHPPPCQDLQAHRMFYALATLAYNALMALKLIPLPESEQPKRVRTLIRHLLWVPVEITRHARQWKACLYLPAGWIAWWRGYLAQWLPQGRQLGTIAAGG